MKMEGMDFEIDSFFTKFKQLIHARYHATLTKESNMGEALCLKAGLGLLVFLV